MSALALLCVVVLLSVAVAAAVQARRGDADDEAWAEETVAWLRSMR